MRTTRTLIALAAIALSLGCAAETPPPGEETVEGATPAPIDESRLDSIALIDAAMAAGDVDYSTAMLYKVYVMFDPMSVPPEYESNVLAKCGTPLIMEVQRNWNRLTPEDRAEISQYIEPLEEPGSADTQLDDVTPDRVSNDRDSLD